MKIDWKDWTNWAGAAFAIAALMFVCISIGNHFDLSKSEWASWMQAIGSIAAILAAIWVSSDQHWKALARERDKEMRDLDGMIRSLRDEIETLWAGLSERVGTKLTAGAQGTPFLYHFPVADNPFVVYDGCAGRIGLIDNDELRKLIVVAYSQGVGLLQSFKLNNRLLEEFNRAKILHARTQHEFDRQLAQDALASLSIYGDALRKVQGEVELTLGYLLAAFDQHEKLREKAGTV